MGQGRSKQENFWDACSYGREWLVKQMISEGIDVNWKSNIHDCYPIHVACQGKPNIVKLLIEAKCQIDARDTNDNTALHHAAMTGHLDCVSLLLQSGAAVNVSNHQFWTPLTNSAYWNQPQVLKLLLAHNADPFWKNKDGRNVLHELCRSKSENQADLVICLHLLVSRMQEIVKIIQTNHVHTNVHAIANGGGDTVATGVADVHKHLATGDQHLLTRIPTLPNDYTPLVISDWIPTKGDESPVELRSSPTDNWDSEADFTPLMFACYHGHLGLVKGLLELNANIHASDQNGWTCLHWAAQRNHIEMVCLLLRCGANRRAKDCHGSMPYMVTTHLELTEALRPNAYYPEILSNGAVTTDEEDNYSDSQSITPTFPSKCRGNKTAPFAIDEISKTIQT